MAYDDDEFDVEDELPSIEDPDDIKPVSYEEEDSTDDESIDGDHDDVEEFSGSRVYQRDPVDAPVISTASPSAAVSSESSVKNSNSNDEKEDEIASLLEDDVPSTGNSAKKNEQVSVPQDNKAENPPSFAPVDSGLGAYVPYAMMVGNLVNSNSDSSEKSPSFVIKSGTPVTSDSFRKKSKKVIELEKQMASIDQTIVECRAKVAEWDKKYNLALSTDTVLAGNYKQSKMEEESKISSLLVQKKSLEEKIKLAVEQDDITSFSENAVSLLSRVRSISNSSFNVDFDVLSTDIDTTSAHLSTLLSSVGQKVENYSSLLHSATDDIAQDRFRGLYNFYNKSLDTLMKSCQTMEDVRKIFTVKYNQHKHEIEQSKQLAVLLSEMPPNNLLYSLFSNLGNQVYALQQHIDSLETKLTEYKKSNEELSKKVNSFDERLKNIHVDIDDDTCNKVAESLSTTLNRTIEKQSDDISNSISDKVSQNFSTVIHDLNESSQKVLDAANATEVVRETNEILTSLKTDREEIKSKLVDELSSVITNLNKKVEEDAKNVVNNKLSGLRKSLYLTGRTVFEGFAKSYGILGQNRSIMFYLTSPVCVLLFANLFLTLYILYSLHFSD